MATEIDPAGPDARKAMAIELLATIGARPSIQEIADQVGVSRQTLWEWKSRPEFREALRKRIDEQLVLHLGAVDNAVIRGAKDGNPQMAKLFYERAELLRNTLDLTVTRGADERAAMSDEELEQKIAERRALVDRSGSEDAG